jgi:tripartite-type tricarboxylate transporter receptor subunit TctC
MTVRTGRRAALAASAAAALSAAPRGARAQANWPDRPVTVVVPFAPGGTPDIGARLLAPKMGEFLGQPVAVENRAGAGSTIGTRSVVQARPDGHTVLMGSISFLTAPLTIQPMPFDPVEALRCVCLVSTSPYILVVRATARRATSRASTPWRRRRARSSTTARPATARRCTWARSSTS